MSLSCIVTKTISAKATASHACFCGRSVSLCSVLNLLASCVISSARNLAAGAGLVSVADTRLELVLSPKQRREVHDFYNLAIVAFDTIEKDSCFNSPEFRKDFATFPWNSAQVIDDADRQLKIDRLKDSMFFYGQHSDDESKEAFEKSISDLDKLGADEAIKNVKNALQE